jgi:hypothetical protein
MTSVFKSFASRRFLWIPYVYLQTIHLKPGPVCLHGRNE